MHEFYWPIAKDDTMEVITKYKDYQFFQKKTSKPTNHGHFVQGTRRI
jgi:hypothetical protein